MSEVWGKGGDGGIELAEEVLRLCEQPHTFRFAYELNQSIKAKIEEIAVAVLPMIALMLIVLAIITYCPSVPLMLVH